MKAIIVALIALAAAGGAGYYGWQQQEQLERVAAELANTRAALTRATGELRSAREMLQNVTNELAAEQAIAQKMRVERDGAVAFLQQEKAYGERLRKELTLAQQQLAFVRARGSVPQFAPPTTVQGQPMVIRALPAPRPQGAAAPAMARPAQ